MYVQILTFTRFVLDSSPIRTWTHNTFDSVAALTGYHEFAAKDFSSKFLHLLYQDAWDQQRVDCAAVGIHLVDEKEEIEKLVKNASPARRKMKTAIIETKMGKVSSKKDMSEVLEER